MLITLVDCGDTSCYWRYLTGAVHHSLIIGTYEARGIVTVRSMWRVGAKPGVVPLCPPKKNVTWTTLGINRDLDTAKVLKEN